MRIYKRGNRWWLDYNQDGKRIREPLPNDITTEVEAFAWADDFDRRAKGLELRRAITDYLAASRTRLSATSMLRYRFTLRNFEKHFGADCRLDQVTGRDINTWAGIRLQSGISPETVNIDLRHVKAFFRRLVDWEILAKAPKIEMVKTPKRLPRHLTEEQFQAVITAEPLEKHRWFFTFLYWTGLRRAEAINLRWEDVTLGVLTISILGALASISQSTSHRP
ncbi:hypothetical protein FACS189460_1020 [Deltaproteobacteria bacterium]|nr:hypothetical protein FACS189460_1020 [Deltaproteobacteria bacterium]